MALPGRGVIFLGHIPFGFFEEPVTQFFQQFGTVTRVRLARSKKTGGYKGYGFVEFLFEDVARVAAEAMNNYLMFKKLLKCVYIPPEDVHADLFKFWNEPFNQPRAIEKQRQQFNSSKSEAQMAKMNQRRIAKYNKKLKRLEDNGVDITSFISFGDSDTASLLTTSCDEIDTDDVVSVKRKSADNKSDDNTSPKKRKKMNRKKRSSASILVDGNTSDTSSNNDDTLLRNLAKAQEEAVKRRSVVEASITNDSDDDLFDIVKGSSKLEALLNQSSVKTPVAKGSVKKDAISKSAKISKATPSPRRRSGVMTRKRRKTLLDTGVISPGMKAL